MSQYKPLITSHFLSLLDEIDYLEDDYRKEEYGYYSTMYSRLQYSAFNILLNSVKSTPLLESLYPQIETQFRILLNRIDNIWDSEFLSEDMKYKFGSKYEDGCRSLVEAVKGTILEDNIDFKKWKAKISHFILI